MSHVICEPCISVEDGSCVEACPVAAIEPGPDHYVIVPRLCVDCGACIPACPVSAIYPGDEVPTEWKSFERVVESGKDG